MATILATAVPDQEAL